MKKNYEDGFRPAFYALYSAFGINYSFVCLIFKTREQSKYDVKIKW